MLGLVGRAPGLVVTAPRAVGVRAPYAAMPDHVRAWVDETLGSPVVETNEQVGGMSPGCATRLVCADGSRAFVKAVGLELNPDTPNLFRREVTALTLLGSHPRWAALLASYDARGWVALLLEDVEGSHPDLDDDAAMARLVDGTDELVRMIHERIPEPPAPDPDNGGLTDGSARVLRWSESFDDLERVPREIIPGWLVERADEFGDRVRELADRPMRSLVHWDIRNDNLIQRPDGAIVFIDWGWLGLGLDWFDPLLARLERVHRPWFDSSLATSPALVRAGDDAITTWLVGLGAFLGWRAHTDADAQPAGINDFRIRESARFLGAVERRLGLG